MKINIATPHDTDIGQEDGYLVIRQEGKAVILNYAQAMRLVGYLNAVRYKEDAWEAVKE